MTKIIEVKNVTCLYGAYDEDGQRIETDLRGIRDINMDVYEGEFLCIVGHNGSGKSTLAKLLNGIMLPPTGNVLVDGMDTKDSKKSFEIRKTVGMVFQNPDNQMVASIIEDDVAFGPENIGVPREQIIQRVQWALDAVNMAEHRHRTPFKLSGGQKQRVAIAGVLALKPRVLVLDESTAMLDPEGRREILEILKSLNKQGMTIILITHFMDEVLNADRVIVMNQGSILTTQTPQQLFTRIDFLQSIGLDAPRIVTLSDKLRQGGVQLPQDLFSVEQLTEKLCQLL